MCGEALSCVAVYWWSQAEPRRMGGYERLRITPVQSRTRLGRGCGRCCEYGNADMSRVHTMDVEQGHRCVCGGQAAHVVMQCRCRGVAGFVLGRLLRVRCCFVSGWRSGAPRKAPHGVPLPCQGLVGGYGSGISSLVSNRLKAAVCMFSHCMLGLRAVDMLVNWILDLCRTWAWVPRGGSSAGHVCGAICSG